MQNVNILQTKKEKIMKYTAFCGPACLKKSSKYISAD